MADTTTLLEKGLDRHLATAALLRGSPLQGLERLVGEVREILAAGGTVLACGNGGSAADAQHLVAELVGRYVDDRPPWRAIALNADGAVLTCVSNDYGYDRVFARQVEAIGKPGDLLLAISTSGRSPSIVQALQSAGRMGLRTAALLGRDGGTAAGLAALAIIVPSQETARIQECHGLLIHLMCEALDARQRA